MIHFCGIAQGVELLEHSRESHYSSKKSFPRWLRMVSFRSFAKRSLDDRCRKGSMQV